MDMTSELRAVFGERVREHEPMDRHTNFRVGGPARWYVVVRTADELARAVAIAEQAGVPVFILGGGSNTLVADTGYPGLVIQMAMRDVVVDGTTVRAGAGALTSLVARTAGDAGLSGFAWAVSLPGTIGGAVRGNAGCFGGEMRDVVFRIDVFDVHTKRFETVPGAACAFRYRHSAFKDHPERIVLAATLALTPGDPAELRAAMDAFLARRTTTQPHDRPSAGCLFTNVEVATLSDDARAALDRATGGAWERVVHDGQLPVGWIVEHLGMKGYRVGAAQISELHGNFTLNLGGATAADVLALAEAVQERAEDAFGVALHLEVQRVGFSGTL